MMLTFVIKSLFQKTGLAVRSVSIIATVFLIFHIHRVLNSQMYHKRGYFRRMI